MQRTKWSAHIAAGPCPCTIDAGLHVTAGISQHRFVASDVLESGTSAQSTDELFEEKGKITTTGDINLAEVSNSSRHMH
jgi:hypothetical protein